jgi:AraC-like DNA-binding protein
MSDPVADCAPFVRLVHDFSPGPAFRLRPRRINDHALLFVRRGEGRLVADGGERPLSAGSLIVVPPDREHAFDLEDQAGVNLLNIHYDPVQREDSSQVQWTQDPACPRQPAPPGPLPGGRVQVLAMRPPAAYVTAFRRLGRGWPEARGADLLTRRAAMLDLLALVLRASGLPAERPPPGRQLERARTHLEDAPGAVRLEDAARLACLGRSAFIEAFVRHYGMPPMAYRRRARIERAKADLLWGGLTVKAAARQAGFATVQHFTRVFARIVGEPPAAFAARGSRPR